MVEGIVIDWQQVAAFLTAGGLLLSGVWFLLKIAIDQRIAPQLEQIRRDINGPLDKRIKRQVGERVEPLERKVDNIDEQLAQHLPGYRRAS